MLALRRGFSVALAVLACAFAATAYAAESLEGVWTTPLGKVRIEQTREGYVGRLVEPSAACNIFSPGADVIRGVFQDEIFTGELRSCFHPKCPNRDRWLFAMAARLNKGDDLTGAIASGGNCLNMAFREASFVLKRQRDRPPPGATPIADMLKERRPKARKMRPEVDALVREGLQLAQAGRFEAAQKKYLKAHEADPTNADILTQIGVTHFARSDFREAEAYYQKAIAAEPSYVEAHYNLACVLARGNRSREALRSLGKAVELGFGDLRTFDTDGDLASLRGEAEFAKMRKVVEKREASRR